MLGQVEGLWALPGAINVPFMDMTLKHCYTLKGTLVAALNLELRAGCTCGPKPYKIVGSDPLIRG